MYLATITDVEHRKADVMVLTDNKIIGEFSFLYLFKNQKLYWKKFRPIKWYNRNKREGGFAMEVRTTFVTVK